MQICYLPLKLFIFLLLLLLLEEVISHMYFVNHTSTTIK